MKKYRLLYLADILCLALLYILNVLSYKKAGVNHHVIYKSRLFIKIYCTGYRFAGIIIVLAILLALSIIFAIYMIRQRCSFFDGVLLTANIIALMLLLIVPSFHKIRIFVYLYKTLAVLALLKVGMITGSLWFRKRLLSGHPAPGSGYRRRKIRHDP